MSKNIIKKLNATLNNSNSNTNANACSSDMTITEFMVPTMDKGAMLEAEYNKAMEKWKKSLAVLASVAQRELALANEYAEDTYIPDYAIARLKSQIARTEEKLKILSNAHNNWFTYLFNR